MKDKHQYSIDGDNIVAGAFYVITNLLGSSDVLPFPDELLEKLIELCKEIQAKESTVIDGVNELQDIFPKLSTQAASIMRRDFVRIEQVITHCILSDGEKDNNAGETDTYCGDEE